MKENDKLLKLESNKLDKKKILMKFTLNLKQFSSKLQLVFYHFLNNVICS